MIQYPQLVVLQYLIEFVLLDQFLHFVSIHVDSVVKVTAPKHVVMSVQGSTHRKRYLSRDLGIVGVAFVHLRLAGGEVGAHEAERRGVQHASDRRGAFVPGGTSQSRFHTVHRHVSQIRRVHRSYEQVQTDADQLLICYENVFSIFA